MSDELRRKFFADNVPNPSLRDLLHDDEEPFLARTKAEDSLFSVLPGDDTSEHLLGLHTNNPYLRVPYRVLKVLIKSPDVSREDQVRIRAALTAYETG